MLELTEGMILHCLKEVTGDAAAATVEYQGSQLDFSAPFRRAPMSELVREACGWDFDAWKGDLPGAKTAAVEALQVRTRQRKSPRSPRAGCCQARFCHRSHSGGTI
jgi:lysyl-tRNA synthetase class II